MLVLTCLLLGLIMLTGMVVAIAKVDRRWRPATLQCCRCLHTWTGLAKMCAVCGGRGQGYIDERAGTTSHDWQGYLDTGPIPVVEPVERAR